MFLFIASYGSLEDATEDYEAIKQLHKDKVIGTYDVAVVAKGENGKVHVKKHEKPTQHGAWGGVAAGAVLGLLFPPGMSRKDVLELGEFIGDSQAALVLVGESTIQADIDKAVKKADTRITRPIEMDRKAFDKEIKEAVKAAE